MKYVKKRTVVKKTVKRPGGRKAYAKPSVSTVKAIVKKEIARNVENKTKQAFNYGYNLYPSNSANFPLNVIELGPSANLTISQGTGQGDRIGNTIKTKRLTWKGTIVPTPYDATVNPNPRPTQVKIWIFYDRSDPTAVPQVGSNFYQDGNVSKGFQNDLVDLWAPVNTDKYRLLTSKTFKLGYSSYYGTAASPANAGAYQYYNNNDFKLNCNFSFDLTKYYPQMVKFSDAPTTPSTRGLFALFHYVNADGTAITSTFRQVDVQWMQSYEYEDA